MDRAQRKATTDPVLRDHMTFGAKTHRKQPVSDRSAENKMAGKKGRKRGAKKVPKDDKNERSAFIEEKKAKLIDEQKKPDEELSSDKLESCLETVAECKTNPLDFLKEEENKLKYVPPFTRKAKRTINRTGVPVSPVTKPLKRPWRSAKQFSKDAPLTERSPPVQDDEQGNGYQNSQKVEEEENKMKEDEQEEEIDVVGIKPQSSCSQKGKNLVLCQNQTTGEEEFLLSSTRAKVPSEVKDVLHNVIEAVCKINHSNSYKSEAALDETTSGKGIESCGSALKSSASIQIPADNSHVNSFEPAPEIAKVEVPDHGLLNDVKGDHGWSRRNIYDQCNQRDISGSERKGTTHNPEMGHSEVNLTTSMNCVDLLSDRMSKKDHCPTSNIDTDLTHTETNFSDSKLENDLLSQTLPAEDSEMKSNMVVHVLMSEDVPGSTICLGYPANELDNLEKQQSPDQMVPAQCEPVTVPQRIPDCNELTMKCHQNGRDMCHTSSECLETPDNEEDKNKHHADETEDGTHCTDPKAGLGKEIEESQPSNAQTALEIFENQETNTSSIREGHTVPTGSESSLQCSSPCKETEGRLTDSEQCRSAFPSCDHAQPPVCSSFDSEGEISEFDCLMAMDCTDSQLVGLESSPDQPSCHKLDARQANPSEMSSHSDVTGSVFSKNVPTDNGMIKGLISELSALNKFIMGAWKDLENLKKQRQARLKLGKGKKLKKS